MPLFLDAPKDSPEPKSDGSGGFVGRAFVVSVIASAAPAGFSFLGMFR